MRLHAFAGTRYATAEHTGRLAGPPYDQIDDRLRDRLHEDPHHFAHLIRPVSTTSSPHRAAAELHQRWLSEGALVRDRSPALYPYEIELSDGGRRLGVCTLVGLEDDASGVIRPHEATVGKTVDERLSLLRETRIDLEPILLLADDGGVLNPLLEADLSDRSPLVEHRDPFGNRHRLYRVSDPPRIVLYQRESSSMVGLIADGHHRYTVARRYLDEHTPTERAAAAKLAIVTSLESSGLRIDPIHRLLRDRRSIEAAAALATSHRRIAAHSGAEVARAVAQADQPAIAVGANASSIELWEFDPALAPETLPPHVRHLAVGWLHEALFPALGLDSGAATDGTVEYRSDPDRLHAELQSGSAALGFWLPPMEGDAFSRAMSGGRLLPPKSTRFLPKVVSGLVWASHDCALS